MSIISVVSEITTISNEKQGVMHKTARVRAQLLFERGLIFARDVKEQSVAATILIDWYF